MRITKTLVLTVGCSLPVLFVACSAAPAAFSSTVQTRYAVVPDSDSKNKTGVVGTLAGSGQPKSIDGKGRNASFNRPTGITMSPSLQSLYVLEPTTPAIRRISIDGAVTTLTRRLEAPTEITFNTADASIYADSASTSKVQKVNLSGRVSNFTHVPTGNGFPPNVLGMLTSDDSGALRITENRSGNIVSIMPDKKYAVLDVGPGAYGICSNKDRTFFINQTSGELDEISADGPKRLASSPLLQFTTGLACDGEHTTFYVADTFHNRILRVVAGNVTVLAGTGKAGEKDGAYNVAEFNAPTDLTFDSKDGILYVVDSKGNTVRTLSRL